MLIGAKIEFIELPENDPRRETGTPICANERYTCMADGDNYTVIFKGYTAGQAAIITLDTDRNLDPDGGTVFLRKNITDLLDALTTGKRYIE